MLQETKNTKKPLNALIDANLMAKFKAICNWKKKTMTDVLTKLMAGYILKVEKELLDDKAYIMKIK